MHSYVLGAYLIEGRPRGLLEFLRAVGRRRSHAEAVPQAFRLSVEGLERRVLRWLEERRTL